jgi:hypothetical protein
MAPANPFDQSNLAVKSKIIDKIPFFEVGLTILNQKSQY